MKTYKLIGEAKVVSLGNDELDNYDYEDLQRGMPLGVAIVEVIYWYERGDYSGSGTIVYLDSRRKWHISDLGHCSCYGPCHNGFSKIAYSLDAINKLLKKEDYYENGGKEILDYLENEKSSNVNKLDDNREGDDGE